MLGILKGAAFAISATVAFKTQHLPHNLCMVQAVLYQFAYVALVLEVGAISFEVFAVMVKNVGISELRTKYAARSFGTVYVTKSTDYSAGSLAGTGGV